jgi:tetratricopeptide (TPR) repeat protein
MATMKRRINLRFLLYLTAACLVSAACIHFVHGFQVRRNAGFLLRAADQAVEEKEQQKALDYLARYLALMPGKEPDVQEKYALLLAPDEKTATTPRALMRSFYVLEKVVRENPDRAKARRRLVEVAMRVGDFSGASVHLAELLKAGTDAELMRLQARCQEELGEYKLACKTYTEVLARPATKPEDYVRLAELLSGDHKREAMPEKKRDSEIEAEADKIIDAMLHEHGASFQAHLASALYLKKHYLQTAPDKERQKARELHLELARALAPDEADVILSFAELLLERQSPAQSRAELERGIAKYADDWRLYRALSRLEVAENKTEPAIAALRQGLVKLPKQIDLLWNLTLLLIQKGDHEEVPALIGRLSQAGFPATELDYLKARLLVNTQEWAEAIRVLERINPLLMSRSKGKHDWFELSLLQESNLMLANCYERLGDPEQAATAYNRILTREPNSVVGRLGLARALWAADHLDAAWREYNQLMQMASAPSAAWVEGARVLFASNLKRKNSNWSEVNRVLSQAEKLQLAPVEVRLLRAEVLTARKQYDEARKQLAAATENPKERPAEIWIGLANLEYRQGRTEAALALLDEAGQQLGDHLELRLARCRYWMLRGGPEAVRAVDELSRGLEKFKPEEQRVLLSNLADAYLQLGRTERARDLWQQVTSRPENKNDLRSRLALFDLALRSGDSAAMSAPIAALKAIEGEDGTLWRYGRAVQLVHQAETLRDHAPLVEASELLQAVAKRRTTWGRVPLVQAQIHDLRGQVGAAIAKYRQAVQLGERNPATLKRLATLLANQGRLDEADEMIRNLQDLGGNLGDLNRLAAELALNRQDPNRALRLAEQTVPLDTKTHRDLIWLGELQRAAGKKAEAEKTLRNAVRLAPEEPDTWTALVFHLIQVGQKDQAELAKREAEGKLPKERQPALAPCYEVLGQTKRAQELYEAARTAQPLDSLPLQRLAYFHLRQNDHEKARQYLEQLIGLKNASPAQAAEAKRVLALVMASRGDYQTRVKALQMVGILGEEAGKDRPESGGVTAADQRTKILILARADNPRQRREAISLLEELVRRQQITPQERLLLAQLCDSVGEWPKARAQLLLLVSSAAEALASAKEGQAALRGQYLDLVAMLAVGLVNHDALAEAQPWLAKLEEMEPKTLRTVGLRAQLLGKQGQAAEAAVELLGLAKADEKLIGPVAALLEKIGRARDAEALYQKYVQTSQKPEATLTLAVFFGRQHRIDDGLDLCERALPTCKPEHVSEAALRILYDNTPSASQCQRVAAWLEAAIPKSAKATELLNDLAAVRRLQRDYRGMIGIYQRILEQAPNDTLTLNNLAWILTLGERKGPEALKAIERAIELDGPLVQWLDTRAVVYLTIGDTSRATKDLEEAISERPTPNRYFHLAQAYHQAKNRSAALDALQRAGRLGIREQDLDPLEHAAYRQLQEELDWRPPPAR